MKQAELVVLLVAGVSLLAAGSTSAQERHRMMQPIVPPDQLEAARALKNPLPSSQEIIDKGKAIYEGKGTCFTCHGMTGHGDGPAAVNMKPSPRNFHHHGMWRHRTEGEIFWVIKNGSPGTAMIAFGGLLSDEEIWTVMQYEKSFSERGHGPGMHRGDGMGRDGPRGSRDGRGRCGGMGGMHQGDPGGCEE